MNYCEIGLLAQSLGDLLSEVNPTQHCCVGSLKGFNLRGQNEFALRQGFDLRQNAWTRQKARIRPPRKGVGLQRSLDGLCHIGALPGQIQLGAAEVTVGGGLAVDGAAEIEAADNGGGAQVKDLIHRLLQQTDHVG